MATPAHEDQQSHASRGESGHGHQTRNESQKLLAVVTNARHALRDAQQVAGATGTAFAQTTLVRPRSASRNRLVRTRMLGGVGRAVSNDRPYPIWAFFCLGFVIVRWPDDSQFANRPSAGGCLFCCTCERPARFTVELLGQMLPELFPLLLLLPFLANRSNLLVRAGVATVRVPNRSGWQAMLLFMAANCLVTSIFPRHVTHSFQWFEKRKITGRCIPLRARCSFWVIEPSCEASPILEQEHHRRVDSR